MFNNKRSSGLFKSRLKNIKSISLVELLVSVMCVGIMVLSFYSLETFSHSQVMSADRRAKVQNSLAYCIEHMSKYVQVASGNASNAPIQVLANGFQVRVDSSLLQVPVTSITPANFNDDVWISYTLTGNTLSTSCTPIGTGSCGAYASENLTSSTRIISGFVNGSMPVTNPTNGFYVLINAAGSAAGPSVDIGLAGLYDTSKPYLWKDRATNPKVAIKTRLTWNSAQH